MRVTETHIYQPKESGFKSGNVCFYISTTDIDRERWMDGDQRGFTGRRTLQRVLLWEGLSFRLRNEKYNRS